MNTLMGRTCQFVLLIGGTALAVSFVIVVRHQASDSAFATQVLTAFVGFIGGFGVGEYAKTPQPTVEKRSSTSLSEQG